MTFSTSKPKENDIVAVSAVRTPIGKFGGSLKTLRVYDLGAAVIRKALLGAGLPPKSIDDVILGCCRHSGNGTNPARTAARMAGLPGETPATTITMACASGMRAVILGIQSIRSGDASMVLAGGMESMSTIPHLLMDARWGKTPHGHKTVLDGWHDSHDPFLGNQNAGITMESLVKKHGISREEQDRYAYESHQKACHASKTGLFRNEIVPLSVNNDAMKTFEVDETIREEVSLQKLFALKPIFMENGTLTAGNSSPLSDGAACIILTTRKKASEAGVEALFSIVSYATSAVDNQWMGEGPSQVLPMALAKAKITLPDIDFVEINEAFAGMVLVNERLLRLKRTKLNKKGGALALGHPVGCSGARILVTLYYTLKHFNAELGASAIGAAGGVCSALIIRRES